jgi:hypothetical protein
MGGEQEFVFDHENARHSFLQAPQAHAIPRRKHMRHAPQADCNNAPQADCRRHSAPQATP